MPELPEVEVVRQSLSEYLTGLEIQHVELLYPSIIEGDNDEFIRSVVGKKIIGIHRLAKYLIFDLGEVTFLSHLRMEGKYFYVSEDFPLNKHIHVVFHFTNGKKLLYQDVRKFGRMELRQKENAFSTPPLSLLGIEANASIYDVNIIHQKLQKKKISMKQCLLDQTIIAGLGNIYVDEVLFAAKINPNRPACSVSIEEVSVVMDCAKEILDKAIECKGTTIRSYTSSLGVTGQYQLFLKVHTKTICPCCKESLAKEKLGGRTTYYCSHCQR